IASSPGLKLLGPELRGTEGVHDVDPLKVVIDVRGTGATGYRLAKTAFELDDPIDLELAAENLVVAIFGLGEPAAAAGERLIAALRLAVEKLEAEPGPPEEKLAPPPPWGELVLTPREAFLGPQEVIPFDAAAGRVAAEGLAAYPPGIPNVLPGERLTAETLDFIRESVAHGGYVRGGSDRELKTLRVAVL
ncbi:MAG: ornithine decarboxylase, partial [Solirubrobacterales bacterium]